MNSLNPVVEKYSDPHVKVGYKYNVHILHYKDDFSRKMAVVIDLLLHD